MTMRRVIEYTDRDDVWYDATVTATNLPLEPNETGLLRFRILGVGACGAITEVQHNTGINGWSLTDFFCDESSLIEVSFQKP